MNQNRKNHPFLRRALTAVLTLLMLVNVCFPAMQAHATEENPEDAYEFHTAIDKVVEAANALNPEANAEEFKTAADAVSARIEDLKTKVAAIEAVPNEEKVGITVGNVENFNYSLSNAAQIVADKTAANAAYLAKQAEPTETTAPPAQTNTSNVGDMDLDDEDDVIPLDPSENETPVLSEAAQAYTDRYNALVAEVDALQIDDPEFETKFNDVYSRIATLNNEVSDAATAGTITVEEYGVLGNNLVMLGETLGQKMDENLSYAQNQLADTKTESVTVMQGGSKEVTLTTGRNSTVEITKQPTSSDGITFKFSSNKRTLTVNASSTTPAGEYNYTLEYTVTSSSGGWPGGGSSSTEYVMKLTVIVQSAREVVLGKFTNEDYPVYLAVRQDGQIPGEPSVQGSSGYNFYNSSYTTGSGFNTFAGTASGIIDTSIVDYQNFFYTSVDGSQTVGLVDGSGTTIKAVLTGVNWDSLLKAIGNSGNVKDKDGLTITESNYSEYTVIPYVIKLQETDGKGWHIDCTVVKKTDVILSYDINIPDGYVISSKNIGVPNTQAGNPPATFTVGSVAGLTTIDNQENAINVESADGEQKYVFMFQGWNTKADGSGTWYQPDSRITISENTVLYAIWNSNPALGTGNLEIEKIVSPVPETDVTFTFKVAISNADSDATFSYVVYNAATVAQRSGTLTNGGTIELHHTEYVEIKDIPAVNEENGAANVTVTEINYGSYQPSWTDAKTYVTIQGGRTSRVTCTNTLAAPQTGSLTIEKLFKGLSDTETKPSVTFTITGPDNYSKTVTLDGTVDTGENTVETASYVATLNDLALGEYTVTETTTGLDTDNYKWQSVKYQVGETETNTVTVTAEGAAMTVTNTYGIKEVEISLDKNVSGNMASYNEEFTFVVTIGEGEVAKTETVKLTHQSDPAKIKVPIGAKVTIMEQEVTGYTASATLDGKGATLSDNTLTIDEVGKDGHTVVFTNTNNATIETGITSHSFPFILLLSTAIVFAMILLLDKARYGKKF